MTTFFRQLSLQHRQRNTSGPFVDDDLLPRVGESGEDAGSMLRDDSESSLISSMEAFMARNVQIRAMYARLLAKFATMRADESADSATKGAVLLMTANCDAEQEGPDQQHADASALEAKSLNVVAPPTCNAAHFLARSTVLRFINFLEGSRSDLCNKPGISSESPDLMENALNASALGHVTGWVGKSAVRQSSETDLITVGLGSIFAILIELNDKDSDLCVRALQSLLNLLQHLPPESFTHTSRETVLHMHSLLRQLRKDGSNQVSECANACMISLAVACGSPELMFSTASTLLCDHKQNVPFNQVDVPANLLPHNFQRLALTVQRTVQRGPATSAMNSNRHNWWLRPLTEHAPIAEFELVYPGCLSPSGNFENDDFSSPQGSICSDGPFVYILTVYGLFKMGTGLTETRAGKVMAHNDMLKYIHGSTLMFCNESLYLRRSHSTKLWVIDRDTLREIGEIMLPVNLTEGVLYADGRQFYHGVLDGQWNFVATPLDDSFSPQSNRSGRISCRLMDIGYTAIGDFSPKQMNLLESLGTSLKNAAVDLQLGTDYGFLLTRTGKMFFSGRTEAFGLGQSPDAWSELQLDESVVSFTLDSHSNCLVLRSGSGNLYALGSLSNMFETNPHKHSTVKKVRKIRIPNRRKCTSISGCGGAMAFSSDNGQCFLHGRHIVNAHSDTMHSNLGLENVSVASVGLGKTHLVVISKSGLVYTCGLNNLNQCGRTETNELRTQDSPQPSALNSISSPGTSQYCPQNAHTFVKDVATICLRCGCCSARGKSCPYGGKMSGQTATGTPIRPPIPRGSPCACGVGESACLRCGICRPCGRSSVNTNHAEEPAEEKSAREEDRLEEDELRMEKAPTKFVANNLEAMTVPGRVVLMKRNNDIKVASVSVGNYHTVLLCADHQVGLPAVFTVPLLQVYTFGCNNNGQLGTGDTARRSCPVRVNLPANVQIVQAVAGANHCVLRTMTGEVITFGAHRSGQLGRQPQDPQDRCWFAKPAFVPEFGVATGRTASWVSARGDRTLIQSHQRLFSRTQLDECQVSANRGCVALISRGADGENMCVMVPTKGVDGFLQFPMDSPRSVSWALNPVYDVLWCFDADQVKVQGFTDAPSPDQQHVDKEPPFFLEERQLLQCTELCVPIEGGARFSDVQIAVFLLSTMYGLSLSALAAIPQATDAQSGTESAHDEAGAAAANANNTATSAAGCCAVGRFLSLGGGWGYSVHCVEAVQFKASRDVLLHGFGLYGGRGENSAKMKLYRNVGNSDQDEQNVELVAETNETLYDSPPRETTFLGFRKPVLVSADVWYIAWVQIHGPSSDCGADGQHFVRADGEVEFQFRNSAYSNNGTDVEGGQIPELYYKLRFDEDEPQHQAELGSAATPPADFSPQSDPHSASLTEDVALSAQTVFTITPTAMRSLFRVFEWGIRGSFLSRDYEKMQDDVAATRQERAAFVTIVSMKIIRIYLGLFFPQRQCEPDSPSCSDLSGAIECVFEFQKMIDELFAAADEKLFVEDRIGSLVIEEAVDMFVSCGYLLMPSPDILGSYLGTAIESGERNWKLLALLKTFCRLENFILPLIGIKQSESVNSDVLQLLADYIVQKSRKKRTSIPADKVVTFMFELAFMPTDIRNDDVLMSRLKSTVQNLIVSFAKHLVYSQLDIKQTPSIYQTPSRFRQTIAQPNWETGNDAHDAIAFKVDFGGVQLQGVGMYAGAAKAARKISYELEVLESRSGSTTDGWSSLTKCSGVAHEVGAVERTECVLIRLAKPVALKPNTVYAVRALMDAGKTFFGEAGLGAVKLQRHGRLTFLPCPLSKNGTTVTRGQLPFLLYSINSNAAQNRFSNGLNVTEEANRLFLLIIRLLSTKLTIELSSTATRDGFPAAQMCSQLVAYGVAYMEANPHKAYSVMAAFDQVLPLISAANADIDDDKRTISSTLSLVRNDGQDQSLNSFSKNRGIVQAVVESAHPYKSNDFSTHFVSFDESVEFVCVRFHEDCQTAHPQDALWVYGAQGEKPITALYAVGRYSLVREWPEGVILIPGNSVWFVFETGAEREHTNNTKKYGFRCTVEGITASKPKGSATLCSLEQEFAWLCSKACHIMVQATNRASGPRRANERECIEVVQKHGLLLQKGLNLDHVPNVAELMRDSFPALRHNDQLQFLSDFISAAPDTLGGLLSIAIVSEPFVDLTRSRIEVEPHTGFYTTHPIRLKLFPLTQYGELCYKPDLQVQFMVRRGATESSPTKGRARHSDRILKSLTVFQDMFKVAESVTEVEVKDRHYEKLRKLQMEERYSPVIINNSRFISIGANPSLCDYSAEELRWAYELGNSTSEVLKVDFSPSNGYEVHWSPTAPGRYHVEASVDGFPLTSRADFNVRTAPEAGGGTCADVPPTPMHRAKPADGHAAGLAKATCPAVCAYAGVRIRSHPTLNAQQVGAIPRGATVTYVETVRNGDGLWLRLSDDVRALYCERKAVNQAWCLQYNNHLKTEHLVLNQSNGNIEDGGMASTRSTLKSSWNKKSSSNLQTPSTSEDNPLRPITVECFRTVFAAFVWHEHLVTQLMECANALASVDANPWEVLKRYQMGEVDLPHSFMAAKNLWSTMATTMNQVVKQHLIMPSPTILRRPCQRMRATTADRLATDASNDNSGIQEELCELCDEFYPKPVTSHMRVKHPGCGGPCFGHGYNSVGNYTTGWTGLCGEGGKGNAVWYLMCPNCRTAALSSKDNDLEEETDRRWREFRQISATQSVQPEVIIRRNAIFLLGLSPTGQSDVRPAEKEPRKKGKWVIDLYPSGDLTNASLVIENHKDVIMSESHVLARPTQHSHTSDPGVSQPPSDLSLIQEARVPTSFSVSGNVFRRHLTNNYLSTIDALPEEGEEEEEEGLQLAGPSSPGRRLPSINEVVTNFSNAVPTSHLVHAHPVLAFVVENHDLSALGQHFEDSIRRAVVLAHAFKVWNWLLKLVTSEASVTDIVWLYLHTMFSFAPTDHNPIDVKFATKLHLLPHPWRLCFLAGEHVTRSMVESMHSFLGTLYVILNADNVDIRLKCLCFRSWTFQLTIHEQDLLYTLCKLLCKVGDVLADTSADSSMLVLDDSTQRRGSRAQTLPVVKQFADLNSLVKLESSSQKQILHCLLDGTNDTFWESGDEDHNRSSVITISWDAEQCSPTMLGLFIDNITDSSYRLGQVNFSCVRDSATITLNSVVLGPRFVGWVRCCVLGSASPITIQLKFNGRSCRLRQVATLGQSNTVPSNLVDNTDEIVNKGNRHQLAFSSAQMDAFALFQAVAAQAFSDEFAEDENGHLRQQVIDMLFDRVQLQPLQIYVCTQMIANLRDKKKRNYSYICGLMVMLVKIGESRKGVEVFSNRNTLPIMLSELVLFAPEIVQVQVLETIEKLLRHFKASSFDVTQLVQNLLAVVAKPLTLQIKDRVTHRVSTASLASNGADIPAAWRAEKPVSTDVVHLVLAMLGRVAHDAVSPAWTQALRAELANSVMCITRLLAAAGFLPSSSSTDLPTSSLSASADYPGSRVGLFLRQTQFWLSVAAMAAIRDPQWLELAPAWAAMRARRSAEPEPLCDNHDDGVTMARFHCAECELHLCYECFTVLHLNKRKKGHSARLVGAILHCPKMDVHEGCTRLRINNFLILFNCVKLSGIAEISAELGSILNVATSATTSSAQFGQLTTSGAERSSNKCRFCQNPLRSEAEMRKGVCAYNDCQEMLKNACPKVHPCGHWCSGILGEKECIPCFSCPDNGQKQDSDDLCVICFTDRLGGAPCVRLECGHCFHYHCTRTVLEKRWHGPRILFRFMQCPLCKKTIHHSALDDLLTPLRVLYDDVRKKALLRLEYDGLLKVSAITSEEGEFHDDPTGYALERYVYVLCNKCNKAYFGGESRCQQALDSSTYKPDELVCGGCSDIAGAPVCGRHGTEFLEYKCRYCCSVAVYFCFGNSHFCAGCHSDFQRLISTPPNLLPKCPVGPRGTQLEGQTCPLRVQHPPTGEEFSLGCGICRNLTTF